MFVQTSFEIKVVEFHSTLGQGGLLVLILLASTMTPRRSCIPTCFLKIANASDGASDVNGFTNAVMAWMPKSGQAPRKLVSHPCEPYTIFSKPLRQLPTGSL